VCIEQHSYNILGNITNQMETNCSYPMEQLDSFKKLTFQFVEDTGKDLFISSDESTIETAFRSTCDNVHYTLPNAIIECLI